MFHAVPEPSGHVVAGDSDVWLCFVATLVEVLTDETIVKQLAAAGVNFELSEYLLRLCRQEIEDVNSIIERSQSQKEVIAEVK